MKDNVIVLDDLSRYYVLDQISLDNNEYIFAVSCSNIEVKNEFVILKYQKNQSYITVNNISDKEEYGKVTNMFLKRVNEC